jgi:pimeloyl-ACP methyl ester carboxylesterase
MKQRIAYAFLAGLAGSLGGCHADPIPAAERYPAGTPFRAQDRVVDGSRLRLIDTGQGPAVVFIHGLGASLYSWRHQLGPVLDAGGGHRVVAFDNRGMGFSERPRTGYDNASYARLLLALLDSLRITDAVLVGHSMGGAVALEAALIAPERVRGLVLIGSAGIGVRVPGALSVARTPFVGPVVSAFRGRGSTATLLRSTYGDPRKVTETEVDQYYAPAAEPGYTRALRTILSEFRFDALSGRLEGVRAPALVVWGARDLLIPVALGRQLAAGLPRAALVVIPSAGHVVQEETPGAVTPLILTFLKEGLPRVPENLAMAH